MNRVLKIALVNILLFVGVITNLASAESRYNSGFQQIIVEDNTRPLSVAIWYPTTAQQPIAMIGDNSIFVGEYAIRDAVIAEGFHPLILVSHGFGGSWLNQAWLASALSKKGYIVAMPNHPGTSTDNINRTVAQNMLERPKDITRTITHLLGNAEFSPYLNPDKIAIIGHSYGAWTAMETLGGQFSNEKFNNACQTYTDSISCHIYKRQMQGLSPDSDYLKLDKMVRDPRIKAAILFDVSFAYGFTPQSLAQINTPILIVSSDSSEADPIDENESAYLQKYLPAANTESMVINEATHFSFIGICKPNAMELLAKKSANEAFICQNGQHSRAIIHQQLIDKISLWLKNTNINN